jgi:CspA family cold shock protein
MLQVAGEEDTEAADTEAADGRDKGTVKWYNNEKGYGFISHNGGGDDLFLHATSVTDDKTPQPGDEVLFESEFDDRKQKWRAANVTGGTGGPMEQGYGGGGYY